MDLSKAMRYIAASPTGARYNNATTTISPASGSSKADLITSCIDLLVGERSSWSNCKMNPTERWNCARLVES
jgi:hypothetical protein